MRTIRVANASHLSCAPYRALRDFDFLRYEENAANENARKLHEGEVDVALISTAEFANHGGYVGMDFGVGCRGRSDSFMLYSNVEVSAIESVNMSHLASSSSLLLRVLMAGYWKSDPVLIRRRGIDLTEYVRGNDAALVLHDAPRPLMEKFPIALDLAAVWNKWSHKPYVSLVWAVRPETLRPEHFRMFNDIFHRAIRARSHVAELLAEEVGLSKEECVDYLCRTRDYYLDGIMIEGIDTFISTAAEHNLVPRIHYRSATASLLTRKVSSRSGELSVREILDRTAGGERLGIRDAMKLAYEASLADLALLAESVRVRTTYSRSVEAVSIVMAENSADPFETLVSGAVEAELRGADTVQLVAGGDLDFWERTLCEVSKRTQLTIQAFTPFDLRWMAALTASPLERVVACLVKAGLQVVSGDGGEMLVDRASDEDGPECLSIDEWLSTIKWVHRYGASTNVGMRISKHDSWEDRLLHLQKLRSLQDETPGIRSFACTIDPVVGRPSYTEIKMRVTALARIFLDNVPSIEESEVADDGSSPGILALCAGADSLRIADDCPLVIKTIDECRRMGMEIDEKTLRLVSGIVQ